MPPPSLTAEDLEFRPPSFAVEDLAAFAADVYGVEGRAQQLRGERDQNVRITSTSGDFVLKVANGFEDPGIVDFQVEALLHLERTDPELPTPRVRTALDGETTVAFSPYPGQRHVVRMLTFLPGDTFDEPDVQHLSVEDLRDIGKQLGRLCRALASFDHPHAEHFMAWDISNGLVAADELWAYAESDVIELAGWTQEHLATSEFTLDTTRRRQVIHNDAHRGNLLRTPATTHLSGLIDFGDMLVAPLVNELAIPGISFVNAQSTPLEALTPLVVGFHGEHPLDPIDVSVLHDSITARAVLTALLFDFQIQSCPEIAADVGAARPRVMADLTSWLTQNAREFHEHISTALEEIE